MAFSKFWNPISFSWLFKSLSREVGGIPFGFLISRVDSYRVTFAGAPSVNLATWPKNQSLLCDIFLDHSIWFVSLYKSAWLSQFPFDYLIPSMFFRSFLWICLFYFPTPCLIQQHSLLYKKIHSSSEPNILSLSSKLTILLVSMI